MSKQRGVIHTFTLIGILAIIAGAFVIKVSLFKECRDAGFSILYCIIK